MIYLIRLLLDVQECPFICYLQRADATNHTAENK